MQGFAVKRLIAPLFIRDFFLLWIGQTISAIGNPFQTVAVTWLVLLLKGSPLDLAYTMLILTIPQALMTLGGGVLIDRYNSRIIILISDLTRMMTSGIIALLAMNGHLSLWLLFMILIFHSVANGIFRPARRSMVPQLAPQETLDGANSLMELTSKFGTLLGAIPAGILIAHSNPAMAFALNSLSFALSVLATLFITPQQYAAPNRKTSLFSNAWQGFLHLRLIPWLVALLLLDACAAIACIGPITIGLPLLAKNVLHNNAQGYSLLVWSFGVGSALGILSPAIFQIRRHRGWFFCLIQIAEAPFLAGVVFTPLPLAMLCLASAGALNGMLSVLLLSLIQANVAKEMMGRMMSFFMLASMGLTPFSLFISGLIADATTIQVLFVFAGLVTLLSAVLGLLVPSLHRLN
ncbi:MFS transporter [Ktedonosporobacter rubrisoli]|uniref:MFS transporter n=1 Tax=Ktedonosporobacter rubrisoli TaxID=2509675 RepID=A0A4P6JL61_KTERU|nr:MFS transporter [Ktedonosporobacter rubrisoli]QBD75957.1 MFS transporter [Ktedonosporobacter rubrisoli]